MKYASVCSGIEAASVAWKPIGWEPAWFSEIDPFACALLSQRHPGVRNLGDMTKIRESDIGRFDLLVGGTPCQSFSVAGLRGGLDDARGNLALRFLQIADAARPEWVVWENVPGVLSSGGRRDFGAILGGLAKCGYGFAYRVLDAQYVRVDGFARAVPQRRNRVFVVGSLGGWQRAAAVLFERACLRGDHPPRREAGEGLAHPVAPCVDASGCGFARTGDNRGQDPVIAVPPVSPALKARDAKGPSSDGDGDGAPLVAHTLQGEGMDASEDGTGRGTPLVFDPVQITSKANRTIVEEGRECHTLHSRAPAIAYSVCMGSDPIHGLEHAMPQTTRNGDPGVIAFTQNQVGDVLTGDVLTGDVLTGDVLTGDVTPAMGTNSNATGRNTPKVHNRSGVRRLTPRECERLQGFPDDYTLIDYRGKPATDSPRYRAIGNSMAVNVMRWIGRRIEAVSLIPSLPN